MGEEKSSMSTVLLPLFFQFLLLSNFAMTSPNFQIKLFNSLSTDFNPLFFCLINEPLQITQVHNILQSETSDYIQLVGYDWAIGLSFDPKCTSLILLPQVIENPLLYNSISAEQTNEKMLSLQIQKTNTKQDANKLINNIMEYNYDYNGDTGDNSLYLWISLGVAAVVVVLLLVTVTIFLLLWLRKRHLRQQTGEKVILLE